MQALLKLNTDRKTFTTVPPEMRNEVVERIGSQFKPNSQDIIRGLTPELERQILPEKIGLKPHEQGYASACKEFWANFSITPTPKGRVLNCETISKQVKDDITGELVTIDFPVNIEDYMVYHFAKQSSSVAKTQEEFDNGDRYKFFLINLEDKKKQEEAEFEMKEKANRAYILLMDAETKDEAKLDWIIEVLKDAHESIEGLNSIAKKQFVASKRDTNPLAFLKAVNDPSLEQKAFISRTVEYGIVTKEGNAYFFGEERLGDSLSSAVAYVKDERKSGTVVKMKERLKEIIKLKTSKTN